MEQVKNNFRSKGKTVIKLSESESRNRLTAMLNVLVQYFDSTLLVRSLVFVLESKCMHELVHNCSRIMATDSTQAQVLPPTSHPNMGRTPEHERM